MQQPGPASSSSVVPFCEKSCKPGEGACESPCGNEELNIEHLERVPPKFFCTPVSTFFLSTSLFGKLASRDDLFFRVERIRCDSRIDYLFFLAWARLFFSFPYPPPFLLRWHRAPELISFLLSQQDSSSIRRSPFFSPLGACFWTLHHKCFPLAGILPHFHLLSLLAIQSRWGISPLCGFEWSSF